MQLKSTGKIKSQSSKTAIGLGLGIGVGTALYTYLSDGEVDWVRTLVTCIVAIIVIAIFYRVKK